MPLAYTRLLEHSHIVLALRHDLKIFSGLLLIVVRPHYLHENSGMETIHTGWLVLTSLCQSLGHKF